MIDGTGDYAPGTPYVNPNTGQVQLLDNTKMPTDKWVISPRVGFNYDVNGDDTTQLRGGSGLFTGRFPFVWLGNQIGNPNWWFHQMVDPDYQFPQVWRTNLGIDQEYDNGLTLSLDVSYTKDINGPQVQNWGFKKPSGSLAELIIVQYILLMILCKLMFHFLSMQVHMFSPIQIWAEYGITL